MTAPETSTLTSIATESSRNSNLPARRDSQRDSDRTSSSLSPFFTRLDDHTSVSSFTSRPDHADSRLLRPHLSDSLPFSTLSSTTPSDTPVRTSDPSCEFESLPRPYTPIRSLPTPLHSKLVPSSTPSTPTPSSRIASSAPSRTAPSSPAHSRGGSSDAHPPPSTLSAVARRHLSKLSASVLPSRDIDTDSVLSEPCSYSNAAFVASDLWLVQRDVQPAEKALVDKDRRRARVRGPPAAPTPPSGPVPPAPSTSAAASAASSAGTSTLGEPYISLRPAISAPPSTNNIREVADPDMETPSSLLVSQFFSGAVAVSRPARLADRDRSDFCADGTTFRRPLPERSSARRFVSSRQQEQSRPLRHSPQSTFERGSQSHIPVGKRRVSTVRRVRWWFRRVSQRIKTEQEHS